MLLARELGEWLQMFFFGGGAWGDGVGRGGQYSSVSGITIYLGLFERKSCSVLFV